MTTAAVGTSEARRSVAAMPSMSGMLMSMRTMSGVEPGRHLEGLTTRRGSPDDLDVALEAKQLREVIAGLRDVVDDEDADLVCHVRGVARPRRGGR